MGQAVLDVPLPSVGGVLFVVGLALRDERLLLYGVCGPRCVGTGVQGGESVYLLLLILLAVVVVALVLGGIGYARRGSQNTTIIEK
jgi:hypothetical protein